MRTADGLSAVQGMNEASTLDMKQGDVMGQERWDVVWERSRAGQHTMVIGPDTLPPAPSDLQMLHVRCDAPSTSGGVLEAAYRCVVQLLGEELPAPEPGRAPFEQGLRQRFLGNMPGPSLDARFVEACNRLANRTEGRAVLGTTFDAALVARLLEEPLARVLEKLQEAVDAGVPLADRGEGQFTMSPETIAALHNSTLPSLLTFWHARLGEILSGAPQTAARGRSVAPADAADDLLQSDPEVDLAKHLDLLCLA